MTMLIYDKQKNILRKLREDDYTRLRGCKL